MQGGKPLVLKNQWGGPISKKGVGDPNVMQQVSACVHQECAAIGMTWKYIDWARLEPTSAAIMTDTLPLSY